MWAFYNWIRDSVKENKPWDKFAREIFTASGSTPANGALNYFVLHKDPIDLAETSTEAFLGQRLTCARCHNHPLEKWTQKQYYEIANLFSRVGIKNGGAAGDIVVFAKTSGDILIRACSGRCRRRRSTASPFHSIRRGPPRGLRELADQPENPYFARAVVNRVWAQLHGPRHREPVDDVRATNPASNEELFAALTQGLRQT